MKKLGVNSRLNTRDRSRIYQAYHIYRKLDLALRRLKDDLRTSQDHLTFRYNLAVVLFDSVSNIPFKGCAIRHVSFVCSIFALPNWFVETILAFLYQERRWRSQWPRDQGFVEVTGTPRTRGISAVTAIDQPWTVSVNDFLACWPWIVRYSSARIKHPSSRSLRSDISLEILEKYLTWHTYAHTTALKKRERERKYLEIKDIYFKIKYFGYKIFTPK